MGAFRRVPPRESGTTRVREGDQNLVGRTRRQWAKEMRKATHARSFQNMTESILLRKYKFLAETNPSVKLFYLTGEGDYT